MRPMLAGASGWATAGFTAPPQATRVGQRTAQHSRMGRMAPSTREGGGRSVLSRGGPVLSLRALASLFGGELSSLGGLLGPNEAELWLEEPERSSVEGLLCSEEPQQAPRPGRGPSDERVSSIGWLRYRLKDPLAGRVWPWAQSRQSCWRSASQQRSSSGAWLRRPQPTASSRARRPT